MRGKEEVMRFVVWHANKGWTNNAATFLLAGYKDHGDFGGNNGTTPLVIQPIGFIPKKPNKNAPPGTLQFGWWHHRRNLPLDTNDISPLDCCHWATISPPEDDGC